MIKARNILTPVSNLGSNTFTMQVPSDEEAVDHEGACFSVSSKQEHCFSVSSKQEQCFFIKEDEEEDDKEEIPPPKIEIEGFSSIKCVQAHGLFNLTVIGMYKPDAESEVRGVLAKVQYTPSVIGGLGSIEGVTYFTNLSDYDIEYGDVVRLDSWNILSGLSNLAIVVSGTEGGVVYIEPLLFGEKWDSRGEVFNPSSNTFISNDEYYVGTWDEYNILNYTREAVYYTTLLPDNAGYVIGEVFMTVDRSIGTTEYNTRTSNINGYNPNNSDINRKYVWDIIQQPCTDCPTCVPQFFHPNQTGKTLGYPTWCTLINNLNISTNGQANISHRRENLFICDNNEIIFFDDINPSSKITVGAGSSGGSFRYSNWIPNEWSLDISESQSARYVYNRIDTPNPHTITNPSGEKLQFDGDYAGWSSDGEFYYINKEGTKSGNVTGINKTLVNGILISADDTSEITQTILDDEE